MVQCNKNKTPKTVPARPLQGAGRISAFEQCRSSWAPLSLLQCQLGADGGMKWTVNTMFSKDPRRKVCSPNLRLASLYLLPQGERGRNKNGPHKCPPSNPWRQITSQDKRDYSGAIKSRILRWERVLDYLDGPTVATGSLSGRGRQEVQSRWVDGSRLGRG